MKTEVQKIRDDFCNELITMTKTQAGNIDFWHQKSIKLVTLSVNHIKSLDNWLKEQEGESERKFINHPLSDSDSMYKEQEQP